MAESKSTTYCDLPAQNITKNEWAVNYRLSNEPSYKNIDPDIQSKDLNAQSGDRRDLHARKPNSPI